MVVWMNSRNDTSSIKVSICCFGVKESDSFPGKCYLESMGFI